MYLLADAIWAIGMTEAEDMAGIGTAVISMTEGGMTITGTADITMTGGEGDMTVTGMTDITITGIENTTKKKIPECTYQNLIFRMRLEMAG